MKKISIKKKEMKISGVIVIQVEITKTMLIEIKNSKNNKSDPLN